MDYGNQLIDFAIIIYIIYYIILYLFSIMREYLGEWQFYCAKNCSTRRASLSDIQLFTGGFDNFPSEIAKVSNNNKIFWSSSLTKKMYQNHDRYGLYRFQTVHVRYLNSLKLTKNSLNIDKKNR